MVVGTLLSSQLIGVGVLSAGAAPEFVMGDNGFLIPHYYGPYPNFATSQLPVVTTYPNGTILSVTSGIRKFVDSFAGLGADNANNLGNYIPVAIPDTTTYPGCDYYEIAVIDFQQQLHSDLSLTRLRGYVQLSTTVIPGGRYPLTYLDGSQILKPDGVTQYLSVDKPLYLGPMIIAQKDRPVRVKFVNLLSTGAGGDLFLPVDKTVMGSDMGPIPMLDANGMTMMNPDGTMMMESYTENRATIHLHGGNTPWISDGTVHQWITPAGEDTVYPKGVTVQYVPDMWFVNGNVVPNTIGQTTAPVVGATNNPGDGASTFYYTNQQSARLLFYHDHSYGITRLNVYAGEAAGYIIEDTTEQALINKGIIPRDQIPLIIQDKTFVPDTTTPITNMWGTFASQIAFQDPTWDTTVWGNTGDLWYPHVYMPLQNPGDPGGTNTFGRWPYSPWFWPPYMPEVGPMANPYYDPANPDDPMEPELIPGIPNPSAPGEAFLDTPVINGVAYPYLELEPKAYRFRILNAADDRAWNLQWYIADESTITFDGRINTEVKMVQANYNSTYPEGWPTDGRTGGVPDPAYIGPSFIQIGNEAGFLPSPAVLPTQPIDWNWDMGTFDFGNIAKFTLFLMPAERADVIVDFSQYAGKTLILYNDSPAPVPASDPRLDYYTGNPDQTDSGGAPSTIAGYGPNTRTIMQVRIAANTPDTAYNVDALNTAFASTATTKGAFEASQNTIIVPQAAYSSAYNQTFKDVYGQIFDTSLTFTPIGQTTPVTMGFESKSLHDEMNGSFETKYGRMSVMLGVEQPKSTPYTATTILYNFADSPTELVETTITGTQIGTLSDGTQIWRITHNGVDAHPMHWHMFDVQLINRVAWDNNIRPPEANELGWKDTIKIYPLQDTYIALRPIAPTLPFDLPNSVRPLDVTMPLRAVLKTTGFIMDPTGQPITLINHLVNFGWEYMWHCHILAHEEMDAMRSIIVGNPPRAPTNLVATVQGSSAVLTWKDNSLSETEFVLERASDSAFTTNLMTVHLPANTNTYTDKTYKKGDTYYYRVIARNIVGDTANYAPANGFPTLTLDSTPAIAGPPAGVLDFLSMTRSGTRNSPIVLRWAYTPSGDQTGFTIQRATDPAMTKNLKTFTVAGTVLTYSDSTAAQSTTYYYRIQATNALGAGAWSIIR